ncbi:hypothetical protein P7K49_008434 [Saguinus oedipus]|uniref:Fork-head domain-containing protein n=1 Tax=Saguinus oedipus TaxID=9490 RepID=A0ABQ9VXQ9_SAGOE|nr:hypothetical protein P7K49_008434 [Saguinus oedipus]
MAIGGGGSGTLASGLLLEDSARLLAPGGRDPGSGPAPAAGSLSGGTQAQLQPQQPLPPPQPGAAGGSGQPRKCSSRRNAWGNLSYADLITRAIESSPDKRLTLSQIYEWMVRCVPYFKDKGDSNSSAGWKVRTHPWLAAGPAGPLAQRETRLGFVGARLRAPGQAGLARGASAVRYCGFFLTPGVRAPGDGLGWGKEAPHKSRAWPGEEKGAGDAGEGRANGQDVEELNDNPRGPSFSLPVLTPTGSSIPLGKAVVANLFLDGFLSLPAIDTFSSQRYHSSKPAPD